MLKDFHGNNYPGASERHSRVNNHRDTHADNQIGRGFKKTSSKSPLKDFFEEQEMKNSKKVSFSNLNTPNDVPMNMGLRSTSRSKVPGNRSELRKLE